MMGVVFLNSLCFGSVLLADIASANLIWYLTPLIVSVSLTYGATRDERIGPIIHNAYKFGVWFAGFMLVIYLIVLAIAWSL